MLSNSIEDNTTSIDFLADKVQNLLGKTILIDSRHKKTDDFDETSAEKLIEIDQKSLPRCSKIDTKILDFNENPISSDIDENVLFHTIYDYIINNNEFEDLTEYHSIAFKQTRDKKPRTLNRKESRNEIMSRRNLSNAILSMNRNLLKDQTEHLRKLNEELIRMEKYLYNFRRKKVNFVCDNYSAVSNRRHQHDCCGHGNDVVNKIGSKFRHQNHLEFISSNVNHSKLPILKNQKFNQRRNGATDKHSLLKTSIKMIRYIDDLLKNYEMDSKYSKSDLTFNEIPDDSVKIHSENIESRKKDEKIDDLRPKFIAWYLSFENTNHQKNYRIFEPDFINLQENFNRKCGKIKSRSMIRVLRIKDNVRFRIETADQRKQEIVQVYLHDKANEMNSIRKTSKKTSNIPEESRRFPPTRPLSPVTRRVFTHRQMRKQTEKLCKKLSDSKVEKENREEEAKRRRMMANIFKQKLKDNAIRGRLNWPITSQTIST
ncbi:hypothetical protein SSS_05346 [Sarcoptes scabiei]|uniref:ALMS motif domain-containing protein n=1 Tax=Sarcoptes scabiei TaxID=52283 RepID=A0A834R509_SARSC|nr:hypothetical protein SSS_05346 [Sarcoptes scabiei]